MKPYPSYKDSGVEWIGEIPRHWTAKRLKYIFTPREKRSETGEEELLSVTIADGVVRRRDYISNDDHISRSESLVGYKICQEMDLVNNIMKMSFRCLGISNYRGIVSPAYSVFYFEGNENIPSYWNYLLRIDKFVVEYRKRSKGIQESRMRLYDDYFLDLFSYLPPLPEQQQISNYLDRKTGQIDELIEKTEQKIKLLKEKRTSLINHCIIKGLDPNVKMKNSGVEWMGRIPKGWDIKRLKYFSSMITDKEDTKKTDIKISPENVESFTGKCFNFYSEYSGQGVPFKSGDILINKLRLYLVKVLLPDCSGFSMGEMIVVRVGRLISNKYYFHLFFNQGLIDLLDSQSTGIKVPRVSPEVIMGCRLPLPPLQEQQQIVNHLDRETQKIDTLIEKENQRIDLLREYRQSLISEVVTGKIDVRDEVLQ